ncbi:alpha/beta fold hydrolase [Agromyces atrinae]|nr:alpha/beta hydrolase [Agromyces atrinae]NYD66325.1 pimeloyl-ACP methyl ester carboxylesterase [Agromyces atrinae]
MTRDTDTTPHFDAAPVQRATIDGVPIAFRDVGDGPPILFLPGWPTDGRTFAPLVDALAPRYRCIIPDLPGAGQTRWVRGRDLGPRAQAALVERLVAERGALDDLTIVGSDSGGMVARWLAARCAPRALVLFNTEIPGWRAPFQRRARTLARWLPGYTSIAMRQLTSDRYLTSPAGFGGTLADHDLLVGSFRDRFIDPLTRSHRRMDDARRSFIAVLDWAELDALSDIHRRITAPTWFIWGRDDPTFPVTRARAMHAKFPDPRGFELIDRARLYVHEDQPAVVRRTLTGILAEVHEARRPS